VFGFEIPFDALQVKALACTVAVATGRRSDAKQLPDTAAWRLPSRLAATLVFALVIGSFAYVISSGSFAPWAARASCGMGLESMIDAMQLVASAKTTRSTDATFRVVRAKGSISTSWRSSG